MLPPLPVLPPVCHLAYVCTALHLVHPRVLVVVAVPVVPRHGSLLVIVGARLFCCCCPRPRRWCHPLHRGLFLLASSSPPWVSSGCCPLAFSSCHVPWFQPRRWSPFLVLVALPSHCLGPLPGWCLVLVVPSPCVHCLVLSIVLRRGRPCRPLPSLVFIVHVVLVWSWSLSSLSHCCCCRPVSLIVPVFLSSSSSPCHGRSPWSSCRHRGAVWRSGAVSGGGRWVVVGAYLVSAALFPSPIGWHLCFCGLVCSLIWHCSLVCLPFLGAVVCRPCGFHCYMWVILSSLCHSNIKPKSMKKYVSKYS